MYIPDFPVMATKTSEKIAGFLVRTDRSVVIVIVLENVHYRAENLFCLRTACIRIYQCTLQAVFHFLRNEIFELRSNGKKKKKKHFHLVDTRFLKRFCE